ncbi:transglutaminase-like domain-containing protein [Harenicola maris]|uniref:transglutaminase-like domain-containing protein n=1 Tax=Harenicola maris TaxID=2841044 RepID=UPI002E1943F1
MLLQIEAQSNAEQIVLEQDIQFDSGSVLVEIPPEGAEGTRRWITASPLFECRYTALVNVTRTDTQIEDLPDPPRPEMPGSVIPFLMPSRYCQSDLFLSFVDSNFGQLEGGAKILAMRDWVFNNFTYDNAASHAGTTATDSFASLAGVCRDYAHMLITLGRAGGIPARFVSAYAPAVKPQDFHAVVEVYLGGKWHLLDPTGMSKPSETVRISAGRDAADVSFLTSYGGIDLYEQSVTVTEAAPPPA